MIMPRIMNPMQAMTFIALRINSTCECECECRSSSVLVNAYLAIALNTEVLDDGKEEQEWNNPCTIVDVLNTTPEMNDLANVRSFSEVEIVSLTLQAAEISNGSTVSQLIPYCHPQAKPQEGSINLTIYMVNAPLIGYMTASSARACIIRYLILQVK